MSENFAPDESMPGEIKIYPAKTASKTSETKPE